jgi:hypothetical protein
VSDDRSEATSKREHAPPPSSPEQDADFADEHGSTTFSDELAGGPEGAKEPESPKGRGGDGGMDPA